MAYLNVSDKYKEIIYSGDNNHKAIITINDNVIPNENISLIKKIHTILSNGDDRFSLDNFVSQIVEVTIHQLDISQYLTNEKNKISITIGTLVDGIYENVPIGTFNIEEVDKSDANQQIVRAICNSKNFDFPYNALPVIQISGKVKIIDLLKDICTQAGVTLKTLQFINQDLEIAIWNNTITARVYVAYIAEKAGSIAVIDRDGGLVLVPMNNSLYIHNLPSNLVRGNNSLHKKENLIYDRVCYEDGVRKFATPLDVTENTTLFINSKNPYVNSQEEIDNIYNSIKNFDIDNVYFEIIGNPTIDAWDLVTFDFNGETYKTLANNTLIFNGGFSQVFETSIGTRETNKENVTLIQGSDDIRIRSIETNIDQVNAELKILSTLVQPISQESTGFKVLELNDSAETFLYRLKLTGNDSLLFPSARTFLPNILKSSKLYVNFGTVNQAIYDLKIPSLRKLNGVSDEYEILNGKATLTKRIGLNEQLEPYVLEEPIVIDMGEIFIQLQKGVNQLWIPKLDFFIDVEYLLDNPYTNTYATTVQVTNQIKINNEQILIEAKSYTDKSTGPEELVASLNLLPTGEAQLIASKVLDLESLNINLTSKSITINSDNFSVDSTGKVTATAGDIGGFKMDNVSFTKEVSGLYEYSVFDLLNVKTLILANYNNDYYKSIYDVDKNNIIDIVDLLMIKKDILNLEKITNNVACKFEINSNNPKKCVSVKTIDDKEIASIGVGGIESNLMTCEFFTCGDLDSTEDDAAKIIGNGKTGTLTCVDLVETSLEKNKKNFEKLENALDIIEEIDIYKYNLTNENDKDKKHIGFVIGDNYRYSKELTNNDNTGVNAYGLSSVNTKAIQELCDIIKIQEKKINKLEEKLKEMK